MSFNAAKTKALVSELLGNLEQVLQEADQRDKLCAVGLYPGAMVPADYGLASEDCAGGMAFVRIGGAGKTSNYPAPDNTSKSCAAHAMFTIEVGMWRPAPMPDQNMNAFILPDAVEQFDAAMQMIDDMGYMHEAIARTARKYDDIIIGSWTPMGPEGDVVGGSWTLTATYEE